MERNSLRAAAFNNELDARLDALNEDQRKRFKYFHDLGYTLDFCLRMAENQFPRAQYERNAI